MRKRSKSPLLLLGLLLSAGPAFSADTLDDAIFDTQTVPEEALSSAGYDTASLGLQWPLLKRFYASKNGVAVWHDNGRLKPGAKTLVEWIASSGSDGLSPQDYHLQKLTLFPPVTRGSSLTLRELMLTDAILRIAEDLYSGRFNPMDLDPLWFIASEEFDPVAFLAGSFEKGEFQLQFDRLKPQQRYYRNLKRALSRYRMIKAQGGWPQLKDGPALRLGEAGPAVAELRHRLKAEGDLPAEPSDTLDLFDKQLQKAVIEFQRRHGLEADGIVGPMTKEALNVPVVDRITQILLNLERWRWLPQDLGDRYLLVNTAGYEMILTLDNEEVLHSLTINGKEQRQTPSFSSRITHLEVNPEWTVPRLIAVEDLLPRQQIDPAYLDSQEIQVLRQVGDEWLALDPVEIEWDRYHADNFPFILRQAPGRKNSLGQIKLHMPNPYGIFLHGTPVVGLFEKPIRAFSSGCVRVQNVEQLARQLLLDSGQSVDVLLQQPLQSGDTQRIELSKSVPIYVVYFTSWVDDRGVVQFRPDIYERNDNLFLAFGEHGQRSLNQ